MRIFKNTPFKIFRQEARRRWIRLFRCFQIWPDGNTSQKEVLFFILFRQEEDILNNF